MNANQREANRWLSQDGLPDGIPHEVYTAAQAGDAIVLAGQVLELVAALMQPGR